mmetsp:Transcript_108248/g.316616  ORF Transcript_108248/g.316616 Transcript_108248/m.316616 type:complete len:227 (-) Transcript_108248:73-753(-)
MRRWEVQAAVQDGGVAETDQASDVPPGVGVGGDVLVWPELAGVGILVVDLLLVEVHQEAAVASGDQISHSDNVLLRDINAKRTTSLGDGVGRVVGELADWELPCVRQPSEQLVEDRTEVDQIFRTGHTLVEVHILLVEVEVVHIIGAGGWRTAASRQRGLLDAGDSVHDGCLLFCAQEVANDHVTVLIEIGEQLAQCHGTTPRLAPSNARLQPRRHSKRKAAPAES